MPMDGMLHHRANFGTCTCAFESAQTSLTLYLVVVSGRLGFDLAMEAFSITGGNGKGVSVGHSVVIQDSESSTILKFNNIYSVLCTGVQTGAQ